MNSKLHACIIISIVFGVQPVTCMDII
jgi:hypothetical protein